MPPLLVREQMSGDREAMSKQSSSICKGTGYDEVYPLGHVLEEGLSQSSEREPSANSPNDVEESYDGEEEGEGGEDEEHEEDCEGEDDEDEGESNGRAFVGGSSGSLGDGHTRPFILSMIGTVNDFKLTMMTKFLIT